MTRRRLPAVVLTALAAHAAAGTAEGSFTQEPGSPVDVGVRPAIVLTADFNADGRPDLLSVEESTLSVLLRKPAGGYALEAGSPRPVGGGPSGAVIADFDGDSLPDVAVSNFVSENVVVLLRQPSGGFAGGVGSPFPLGFRPGAIAVGDFAGDAAPDLAVTDFDGGGVKVLRRAGGSFVAEAGTLPTGTNPRHIAAADFDGAGGTDLAVTDNGSSSVTILLRQGATFAQETGSPVTVGASPQNVLARDFDGDGRPDLAIANYGDDSLTLLLRQAGGGFAHAPGSPFSVGDAPVGIAGGDFNFDGLPDLVITNQAASTATVLLRTAGGGFVPDSSSPVATDTGATGVAVADADADGRPDIAVGNYTDNSVTILLNTTPSPPPPPPPNLDADGDGAQRSLDCDDADPGIHPGAPDTPGDGVDQDCKDGDAPYPLLSRRIAAFLLTYPRGAYTKFTSMTVKPVRAGDRVRLTCRGRGCPFRKKAIRAGKDRRKLSLMRHLEGAKLRRGAVVKLRVTRPLTIGRTATWRIRAPRNARIVHRCLPPGAKRPGACPR